MDASISESVFTPATLLWVVAVLIAVSLLFGSINRRRVRLTESLRDYVDETQLSKRAENGGGTKPSGEDD